MWIKLHNIWKRDTKLKTLSLAFIQSLFRSYNTFKIGLVGTHATIQVHEEWTEPAILWFIVAARKGERKSPALRRILDPLMQLQTEIQMDWRRKQDQNGVEDTTSTCTSRRNSMTSAAQIPQILIDLFSMEELHSVMKRNGGQVMWTFRVVPEIILRRGCGNRFCCPRGGWRLICLGR